MPKPKAKKASLRIGAVDYEFQCIERLEDESANRLFGRHNLGHSSIKLDTEQSCQSAWNILWHESLHAIFDAAGVKEHPEESIIRVIAEGICGAIRNNPILLAQPLTNQQWEKLKKTNGA